MKFINKLILAFIIISLTSILSIFIIFNHSNKTLNQILMYSQEIDSDINDIYILNKNLILIQKGLYQSIAITDELQTNQLIQETQNNITQINQIINNLTNDFYETHYYNELEVLKETLPFLTKIKMKVLELILIGNKEEAMYILQNEGDILFTNLINNLNQITDNQQEIKFSISSNLAQNKSNTYMLLIIIVILNIIISIILIFSIVKSISINEPKQMSNEIGNIDLDIKNYNNKNESQNLSSSIQNISNELTNQTQILKELVKEFKLKK